MLLVQHIQRFKQQFVLLVLQVKVRVQGHVACVTFTPQQQAVLPQELVIRDSAKPKLGSTFEMPRRF